LSFSDRTNLQVRYEGGRKVAPSCRGQIRRKAHNFPPYHIWTRTDNTIGDGARQSTTNVGEHGTHSLVVLKLCYILRYVKPAVCREVLLLAQCTEREPFAGCSVWVGMSISFARKLLIFNVSKALISYYWVFMGGVSVLSCTPLFY